MSSFLLLSSSLLLTPGPPPPVTQHLSSTGERQPGKRGSRDPKEVEPMSPSSPPSSVMCRLRFPLTFEELRSVGSHVPGQVGQVAWVFGRGHDTVSLGLILFGFWFFICWCRRILRLSVPLPARMALWASTSRGREYRMPVVGSRVPPLLSCFIIFVVLF